MLRFQRVTWYTFVLFGYSKDIYLLSFLILTLWLWLLINQPNNLSTWHGWSINRPAWFDYWGMDGRQISWLDSTVAWLADKSALGLLTCDRQKLMFIYTGFNTLERRFHFLVFCFKNCVYICIYIYIYIYLLCAMDGGGASAELGVPPNKHEYERKKSVANSKDEKKTMCQVKVCSKLSPCAAEGINNSAAKFTKWLILQYVKVLMDD